MSASWNYYPGTSCFSILFTHGTADLRAPIFPKVRNLSLSLTRQPGVKMYAHAGKLTGLAVKVFGDLVYVYIRPAADESFKGRYVSVFCNPSIAGEWWRWISKQPQFTSSLHRLGPRLYTYDPTLTISSPFLGYGTVLGPADMAVTQMDNQSRLSDDYRQWIFPTKGMQTYQGDAFRTSFWVANGNRFFVRSRVNLKEYWYCPQQKYHQFKAVTPIYTSTTNRTMFQLESIPTLGKPSGFSKLFFILPSSHLTHVKGRTRLVRASLGSYRL
ncbi:hypothetical protein BJ138DRAFT_1104055 [Hygrophoropsis aurantiaca]|uniref:Uncharacterized protein n=1 Tax=Hygrophoropsis aurantiaca TaxID=72124 RepID=A0ACB8A338_9AGAM|nr:hypothetical protein BJ138DRAFT_1104055 [Hygrophoropsis aurantiaca]